MVRSVFKILLLALKISSRKATVAVGKNPSIQRTYSSFSRARNERGPKISSGVVLYDTHEYIIHWCKGM